MSKPHKHTRTWHHSHAAGARPRTTVAGATVLPVTRSGNRAGFVFLAQPDGTTTPLGSFYYRETGARPPTKFLDLDQPLIREGPNDYVLLRNGLKRLVRILQPDGKFGLTGLGKLFFKDNYTEYLAHVPVIIRGTRRRGKNAGKPYERTDRLPVNTLGLRLTRLNDGLSQQEILARVKEDVLTQGLGAAPFVDDEGNRMIMELSEEIYYLDESRDWVVSSQHTQYINDEVRVETVLNQRLAKSATSPSSFSPATRFWRRPLNLTWMTCACRGNSASCSSCPWKRFAATSTLSLRTRPGAIKA